MSRMWLAWISVNSNGAAISRGGPCRPTPTPDQRDDRVDHVERLDQALDDVRPLARLLQPELGAPRDDVDLVVDVHRQRACRRLSRRGHAVDQREHVHREVRLHRRVLVELVEHDLRVGVALELDHEPDGVAGRTRCGRRGCLRSLRSLTSSAIFWPITSTDVWYGTSVTTMLLAARTSTTSATAASGSSRGPCGTPR